MIGISPSYGAAYYQSQRLPFIKQVEGVEPRPYLDTKEAPSDGVVTLHRDQARASDSEEQSSGAAK
jgi:hypothetical protein